MKKMNRGTANILAMYLRATEDEKVYGETWYATAHETARRIATKNDLPLSHVVGVLAALSPLNQWSQNVADAEALCQHYVAGNDSPARVRCSTFGANKRKAWHILTGEHTPDEAFSPRTSAKTRAFYRSILDPTDADGTDGVVIDGHALCIWQGQRVPLAEVGSIGVPLYRSVSADYIAAAKLAGITPMALQATTWLTYRSLYVNRAEAQQDLFRNGRPGKGSAA